MMPAMRRVDQAFTLLELLILIVVLALFVGLLMPEGGRPAKTNAKGKVAQSEEANMVAAIDQYYAEYNSLPASSNAMAAAGTNDFTFGTIAKTPEGRGQISSVVIYTPGENAYQNYNSEVIAILRDDNFWPEQRKGASHVYNPQQTPFFSAPTARDTNSPGIGPDDVLRDPWGNPYIITLDLNKDNKCHDATLDRMYRLETPKPTGHLTLMGNVIVWSFGPSKTIDVGQPLNRQTIVTSF
jgi:type II secretory pathway pseudopilin PulG